MKIIGIKLYPLTLRFGKTIEESFGTVGKEEKNTLVQIFTDEGIYGLGEAVTLGPFYSSESQGTVMDLIANYLGPKVLLGENPFNVDKIVYAMERVATGHAIAKSAIDFALYDIMGKKLGVPVYNLLGGSYTEKIPLRLGVVGAGSPQKMAELSLEGVKEGYRALKIKCGVEPKRDVECVRAVREAVGEEIDITVDVNQAYTPGQAIRIIREMEKYNVLLVEQPVPQFDLEGLKRVRANVDTAIGACESSYTIYDIMKIIKLNAADVIQFKVTRSGGFYRGKQIVGMIRAAGMSVVGSTQLGMGVEVACTAHFAVSNCQLGHSPYERQGYGSGLLGLFNVLSTAGIKDDIVTPTPLIADGYLYVPQSPGLGVEINPDGLARFQEGAAVEIGECPTS